jgi:hypothetical protein
VALFPRVFTVSAETELQRAPRRKTARREKNEGAIVASLSRLERVKRVLGLEYLQAIDK